MKNKKTQGRSILFRLCAITMLVVLLVSSTFLLIIYFCGGLQMVRDSACAELMTTVESRAGEIENAMSSRWGNLEMDVEAIDQVVSETLAASGKTAADLRTDRELRNTVESATAETVLGVLRRHSVVDSFLILESDSTAKSALVLRDLDPDTNMGTDDVLVQYGLSSIAQSLGAALNTYWASELDMEQVTDDSFYSIPLGAAGSYEGLSALEMARYSTMFKWRTEDMNMMAYSVPLLDDTGYCYGVLGIALSEDYMKRTMLLNKELNSDGVGSYYLIHTTKDQASVVISNGPGRLSQEDLTALISEGRPADSQVVELAGSRENVGMDTLDAYSLTSPYVGERWILAGAVNAAVLFEALDRLMTFCYVAFAASLMVGGLAGILSSHSFTKPITEMVNKIRKAKPYHTLHLDHTGLMEIDELGIAIRKMQQDSQEYAGKVATILDMTDLPLGAAEYDPRADRTFCTEKMQYFLGLDMEEISMSSYLDRKEFEKIFPEQCIHILEQPGKIVYEHEAKYSKRWLQMVSMRSDQKMLITVLDVTAEMQERRKIEYERDHDNMTHLLSRHAFDRIVDEYISHVSDQEQVQAVMIMWDLDNLKYVNDSYGHDMGDWYIKKAAEILGALEIHGVWVSRISGDEFMVFIPDCRDRQQVIDTMVSVKETMNSTTLAIPGGGTIVLRASAGIAWYPKDGTSANELKRHADFAMYEAKNNGKGSFCEFNRQDYERDYYMLHSQEDMNHLIEQRLVRYAFQPIVDARDGSVFAYEALMRPQIDSLKNPADVIRLATMQSKLHEIEWLTFCCSLAEFNILAGPDTKYHLFINSVPNQVFTKEEADQVFAPYSAYLDKIVIEIIESEQMQADVLQHKMKVIEDRGFQLALDDYGSGYNSEGLLLELRVAYVKIDRTIVQGCADDPDRQELVNSLLSYAHGRKIKVIAEGVETREDMLYLQAMGVDYLQGYYLGKPHFELREVDPEIRKELLKFGKTYGIVEPDETK